MPAPEIRAGNASGHSRRTQVADEGLDTTFPNSRKVKFTSPVYQRMSQVDAIQEYPSMKLKTSALNDTDSSGDTPAP